MWAIRSLIWPWTWVIAASSRGECAASASADVEAHVRPPVVLEGAAGRGHPLGQLVEAIEVVRWRARPPDVAPVSTATR